MTEFWVEPINQRLYVGNDVFMADVAAGLVDPRDCSDLRTVIDQPKSLIDSDIPKMDVGDWTPADYQCFGRFVSMIINNTNKDQPGAHRPIRENHLRNLYNLGLGPSDKRVKHRYANLANFNGEIGLTTGHQVDKYKDWSFKDFVDHLRYIRLSIGGRKPTREDVDRFFKNGKGPSYILLYRRCGSLNAVNEMIGFPDLTSWDNDDRLDYGVRVMEANDGHLSQSIIDNLSLKSRGPCHSTICNHFPSFQDYKEQVEARFRAKKAEQAERHVRLVHYLPTVLSAHKKDTADKLAEFEEAPITKRAEMGAKVLVARTLIESISPTSLTSIVLGSGDRSFITHLRSLRPCLTAGQIEAKALELGVFDDIWPLDDHLTQLRVA